MNGKQEYRMGVGASSILMIFVVLSLTTLGVLSFASARADLTLSQRRQAQVEAYYGAVAQAERMIAEIDAALLAAEASPEAYEAAVRAIANEEIDVASDLMISFAVPASDSQQLEVALLAHGPDAAKRYTVNRYQLVNIAEWEPDQVSFISITNEERGLN